MRLVQNYFSYKFTTKSDDLMDWKTGTLPFLFGFVRARCIQTKWVFDPLVLKWASPATKARAALPPIQPGAYLAGAVLTTNQVGNIQLITIET